MLQVPYPNVTCKTSLTFQRLPKSISVEGRFPKCGAGQRKPAVYLPGHQHTRSEILHTATEKRRFLFEEGFEEIWYATEQKGVGSENLGVLEISHRDHLFASGVLHKVCSFVTVSEDAHREN